VPDEPLSANAEAGKLYLYIIIAAILGFWYISRASDLPVGSQCAVRRVAYGLRDLADAYDSFERARKAGDAIGINDLLARETAVLLPEGTTCLIIDSNVIRHFRNHRQIRITSGPYFGKAVWVVTDELRLTLAKSVPTSSAAPAQSLCSDPHEVRGLSGVCWCGEGYRRDVTTQKCVVER
jgi:hypothetical protein